MTTDSGPETIGRRLTRVAQRLPDKLAIVEGEHRVDFEQLDFAATAIAKRIVIAGQDRAGFVCLLFESRIAAIKAIFGAGRTGRAYVPLDAGDPDERLRLIFQDSEPIAVLTEASLLDRARKLAPAGCAIIDIAEPWPVGRVPPFPELSSETPLNLFYTSGSTGQPKGVGQTHGNMLFFADAYAKALAMRESDRVSLLYTLSFSASNMDIFGSLLNGATLYVYDTRRDGVTRLASWLEREQITMLHAVPTVFRELFNGLAHDRVFAHLRAIDLGGETVFDSDVDLFRRHTREHCIFVNHLAATEASVIAQHVVEHRSANASDGVLSVGRSPVGLRVQIRRDDGSEAHRNEVGAIVVSSAHVSPGYWRRPELNAAAFAADAAHPGSRFYVSGDLGRIDDAGNLHFLGRKGSRIKIRGHSVDLSEVEAALAAYPGIVKAAVLAAKSKPQSEPDRLVAYLAVTPDTETSPLLVRRRLAARLPSYMLPSVFHFLDSLPLTASGKIDRNMLAALTPRDAARGLHVDPPRDDLERAVAEIFEQLLVRSPISRGDDFFLLGGDSLSVVELQTRLSDVFGVNFTNVHEDATVAAIAAGIRGMQSVPQTGRHSSPVLVPLRERGSLPPLFLIHGRLGHAFVSPKFLQLLGDEQPVWALQARGLDGTCEPHSTIESMGADYFEQIRKQRPAGPYFLGALCSGAYIAIAIARALRDAGETVLPLLLLDPPSRPPNRVNVSEESLRKLFHPVRGEDRGGETIADAARATAAARTAMALEYAVRRHRPSPFDGAAYLLSSRARILETDPSHFKRMFSGKVERFEVAATHSQVLETHNLVFASRLTHCLDTILATAGAHAPRLTTPHRHVGTESGFAR